MNATIARRIVHALVAVALFGIAIAAPPQADAKQALNPGIVLGSSKDVAIRGPQTRIHIDVPTAKLRGVLADLDTAGAVKLVLHDVTADEPPGTQFNVYVAEQSNPAARRHVGTISWFGAFDYGAAARRTLTYDITKALRELGGPAVAGAGLAVVIEATTGRVSTDPSTAEQQRMLAAQRFRVASNLRIGSVELRAAPRGT